MTIKRGRWAARVPGLRWGGQQIPREPRMTLDIESFDVGYKDVSSFVVMIQEGDNLKVYPHQQELIHALESGYQIQPLHRIDRDIYAEFARKILGKADSD